MGFTMGTILTDLRARKMGAQFSLGILSTRSTTRIRVESLRFSSFNPNCSSGTSKSEGPVASPRTGRPNPVANCTAFGYPFEVDIEPAFDMSIVPHGTAQQAFQTAREIGERDLPQSQIAIGIGALDDGRGGFEGTGWSFSPDLATTKA